MAEYQAGDYVKVEFSDEGTGESEWMWVEVRSCDDEKRLLFGRLDNVPVVHSAKLKLGSEIAVSYDQVRERRGPSDFAKH
jgi:hypothetical protein